MKTYNPFKSLSTKCRWLAALIICSIMLLLLEHLDWSFSQNLIKVALFYRCWLNSILLFYMEGKFQVNWLSSFWLFDPLWKGFLWAEISCLRKPTLIHLWGKVVSEFLFDFIFYFIDLFDFLSIIRKNITLIHLSGLSI